MGNIAYVVIEYNIYNEKYNEDPKETIVGVFTDKKEAESIVKTHNNFADTNAEELYLKIYETTLNVPWY